jgi:hypothetical protein
LEEETICPYGNFQPSGERFKRGLFYRDHSMSNISKKTEIPTKFVDISTVVGSDLTWTHESCWPQAYLVQTDCQKKLPVLRLKKHSVFGGLAPADIQSHAFQGTLRYEWIGEKPSFLQLAAKVILSFFFIPSSHRQILTLRDETGNIVAIQDYREIVLMEKRYRISCPGSRKLVLSDGENDLFYYDGNRKNPLIKIYHVTKELDILLAFFLIEGIEISSPAG